MRRDDLAGARLAVSALVGRDTDRMDGPACRRAAVESLSENLTDGFVSPVFWYVLGGPARARAVQGRQHHGLDGGLQDAAVPAFRLVRRAARRRDELRAGAPDLARHRGRRAGRARLVGRKAWRVGLGQHALLLGPNSGWSEAATAGALERRIVGPIWLKGAQVTDLWIGDPDDPPLSTGSDVVRAIALTLGAGVTVVSIAAAGLLAAGRLLA